MINAIFLTQDQKIKKHIIRPGIGDDYPKYGQIVLIHCKGIIQSSSECFLDTTNLPPLEFEVGKEAIEGLSISVSSLKIKEKSLFTLSPEYAYGAQGCQEKYQIPPNSTLLFQIELVSMKPFFETKQEAIDSANQLSALASDLFHNQQFNEAIEKYEKAIYCFSRFYGKDVEEITTKIYRNLSVAYAKLSQWKQSLYNANRVVQKEPNDLRAIARITEGNLQIGNFDEARIYIDKGLKLSNNNALFVKFKKEYDEKIKEDKIRQAVLLKKMVRK